MTLCRAPTTTARPRAARQWQKCSRAKSWLGYAFVNADWVNSIGYSGQPIQILVGLAADGKIAGARLMAHHEPIVLIGIPPERIAAFIRAMSAATCCVLPVTAPQARPAVDIVSGADSDGDGDRRKHGARGDQGGARRGHRRPGAG